MKVVLTQDIDSGDKWDVLDVADGYARNYLIPLNMALPANNKNMKTVEDLKRQQAKKIEQQKSEIEKLKEKIDKLDPITISVKAGEKGKLFGSVTHADIVSKIKEVADIDLEKKRLQTRSLKEAGKHEIGVKLPFGMHSSIIVIVEADIAEHGEEVVDMREVLHKKRRRSRRKEHEVENIDEKKDESINEKNISEDIKEQDQQTEATEKQADVEIKDISDEDAAKEDADISDSTEE